MTVSRSQPVLASNGQPDAEPSGRWRKRPVVVDAWRYPKISVSKKEMPEWLRLALDTGTVFYLDEYCPAEQLAIHTLEGVMRAKRGDWIIRGVAGEIYPCKPDIFAATYEPADTTGVSDEVPGKPS